MPVDPQIQALLDKGTGVPATHTLPVDVARAQYEARIALMAFPAEIAGVREQIIDGPGARCPTHSRTSSGPTFRADHTVRSTDQDRLSIGRSLYPRRMSDTGASRSLPRGPSEGPLTEP